MKAIEVWKQRARQLRIETYALYLACKDTRTPWYARLFAACVVGYAFSPIDLIPDSIPVLGYLDDLLLIPLGITIALKMIPTAVLSECRAKAQTAISQGKPTSWIGPAIIISLWLLLAALTIMVIRRIAWD